MSQTREAAMEWWIDNRIVGPAGLNPSDGFLAGWDAAKAEPVTTERDEDGLRRAIQGVLWNASNYPKKVTPHMLGQDVGPLTKKVTDAVIAHLAAQPVTGAAFIEREFEGNTFITTGAIEYGLRDDATGHITSWGEVNFMVDAKDYPGYTLVRRTASEWTEAPNA